MRFGVKSVAHTQPLWRVFRLLLQRKFIELATERELSVDAFLSNVEVLHVEEALCSDCIDEVVCELLIAFRGTKKTQVDGDKVSPIEIFLQSCSTFV